MTLAELAQSQLPLSPGISLLVVRDGRPLQQLVLGEASPGQALTPASILLWLSSGKPITAVAIALLYERRRLHLDSPVTAFIPEFAPEGKHAITIRHLLTHTAGLHKTLPVIWDSTDWNQTLARICQSPLPPGFIPGQSAAYDPAAAWFILGEIIQRVADEPFESFVRSRIFAPCDMPSASFSYPSADLPIGLARYYSTLSSIPRPLAWNSSPATLSARPGASLRAPIGELANFYQALLDDRLLALATRALFTSPARGLVFDQTFAQPMDWALGFMVKGNPAARYSFSPNASSTSFGHGGQQSSIAFADPALNQVTVLAYTGLPGENAHHRRTQTLLAAIAASSPSTNSPTPMDHGK